MKFLSRLTSRPQDEQPIAVDPIPGATTAHGKLPDFIIAGFSKCGTKGLIATLNSHPEVQAFDREPNFFGKRWSQGADWYRSYFSGICAGEATPAYVYSNRSMRRMAATIPGARLIFCVRNPVDRLYSWYHHKIIRERMAAPEELPFSAYREFFQAVRAYDPLLTGRYAHLIRENVLPYFPRSQCLFVIQERMLADPQHEMEQVLQFLGRQPLAVKLKKRNRSKYDSPMPAGLRAELVEYYRPHNAEFLRARQVLDTGMGQVMFAVSRTSLNWALARQFEVPGLQSPLRRWDAPAVRIDARKSNFAS